MDDYTTKRTMQIVIHRLMNKDGQFDGEALWAIAKLAKVCDLLPEELLEFSMVTVKATSVDANEKVRIAIASRPLLELSRDECREKFIEGRGVRVHKLVANQLEKMWQDKGFVAKLEIVGS